MTDEEFLRRARARWLLTPQEWEECRRVMQRTGRSASEVALDLRLIEPSDERLIRGAHPGPGGTSPPSGSPDPARGDSGGLVNRRWRVEAQVGEGGMGRVYRVVDTTRGADPIALKTVRLDRAGEHGRECLANEFRLLAGLRHPNVQEVYDFGIVEEGPAGDVGASFFTCEWIEGDDLRVACAGLDWREILHRFVPLCRGLQFLHSLGILHGDVKPENVMVRTPSGEAGLRPEVRLVDFGLARPRHAQVGTPAAGTPAYLPPERIREEPPDPRSDLYSLGVTLFEMLARDLPYRDPRPRDLVRAHLEAPVPSLSARIADVPPALEDLVRRLMAKWPGERPASANEVIEALAAIAGESFEPETAATLRGYVGSGALAGRDESLARMRAMWEGAEADVPGPRMRVIRGEAGIGKSRLAREFRIWAQTRGVAVAEGSAESWPGAPFGLLRDALRTLVRQVEIRDRAPAESPGLAARYAPYLRMVAPSLGAETDGLDPLPPPDPLDPEAAAQRFADRLSEFVREAAGTRGLVLVLEALHAADAGSVSFVESLARKAALGPRPARIVVVVTLRSGEGPEETKAAVDRWVRAGLAEIDDLGPLDAGEQTALVRSMFGPGSDEICSRVLGADGSGNPHLLGETLRFWVDERLLERRSWGWILDRDRLARAPNPRGAVDAVALRLIRLGAQERDWVERVAAWGGPVSEGDLALVRDADAAPDLTDLVRRGLLREESGVDGLRWRLTNAATLEAVRAGAPPDRWRSACAALLARLEEAVRRDPVREDGEIERLARLAWDAGDVARYRQYGQEAARQAERRFAYAEALSHGRRLVHVAEGIAPRAELLEKIGDLESLVGGQDAAERAYDGAMADVARRGFWESPGPVSPATQIAVARLLRKRARLELTRNRVAEARHLLEQALREVRGCPGGATLRALEESRVLTSLARLEGQLLGHVTEAERLGQDALESARSCGVEGLEEKASAHLALGLLHMHRGDPPSARSHFESALEIHRERGDRAQAALLEANLGRAALEHGDRESARRSFQTYLDVCLEIGNRRASAHAWGLLSLVHHESGEIGQARDCMNRQLALARELGDSRCEGQACSGLGTLAREQRDFDRAIDMFERKRTISEEAADRRGIAVACLNLGLAYGDRAETHTGAGAQAAARSDRERALTLHRQSLALADEIAWAEGGAAGRGNVGIALCRLAADGPEGDALRREGLALLEEAGRRYAILGHVLKEEEVNTEIRRWRGVR